LHECLGVPNSNNSWLTTMSTAGPGAIITTTSNCSTSHLDGDCQLPDATPDTAMDVVTDDTQ